MKKMALLIILSLLMTSCAIAQEVVSAFDDAGKVIMNEELRKSSEGIRNIKSQIADLLPIDLASTSEVYGALPIANGGTGQVTAQAAIDALLPEQGSANGKYLTSNGSASSWGTVTQQLILVSTTNVAGSTTGSIAIDKTKNYLVMFNFCDSSGTERAPGQITLTLEYSSGTTSYGGKTLNGTGAKAVFGYFYLSKSSHYLYNSSQNHYYISSFNGYSTSINTMPSTIAGQAISGVWSCDSNTLTSFAISGGSLGGEVKLYEVVQ